MRVLVQLQSCLFSTPFSLVPPVGSHFAHMDLASWQGASLGSLSLLETRGFRNPALTEQDSQGIGRFLSSGHPPMWEWWLP